MSTALREHVKRMVEACEQQGYSVLFHHGKYPQLVKQFAENNILAKSLASDNESTGPLVFENPSDIYPITQFHEPYDGDWDAFYAHFDELEEGTVCAEDALGFTSVELTRNGTGSVVVGQSICSGAERRYNGNIGCCIALSRAARKAGVILAGIK